MSTYLLYGCGNSHGPQGPSTYPPDVVLPGEANPPVAQAKTSPDCDETKGNHDSCHGCQNWMKSCGW